LIVNKYQIKKIPKSIPFWHEMFKIVSVWGAPSLQTPLGELTMLPQAP